MLGKLFDKILEDKEELEEELEDVKKKLVKKRKFPWRKFLPALLVFLIALLPRLYFLYTNDPENPGFDWYGDVYHHWQIAYLSKTVGFKHGFLRLWDLKGMEYFWGLLHPLVLIILFTITGSVDIVLIRLLSLVCGSLVVVLIFLLVKRDFNAAAAWASALFLAFFPVVLFSDTLGMQEPLGLVLILGGILAWPRYGLLTGFLWGLASMERAEYWLFSAALVFAALLDKRKKVKTGAKIGLLSTWLIVIALYMKYLATWTNNYIYPIYWNFLASVIGQWFKKGAEPYLPHSYAFQVKIAGIVAFFLSAVIALLLLKRRRRYYLWFLLGFFNLGFVGFMFGFAAYSWGYIDRFLVDRLFSWPYGFLGILLSIFLLYTIPKKIKLWGKLKFGWLVWLAVLSVSMFLWKPINYYFTLAQKPWPWAIEMAEMTTRYWDKKGKILVPENMPHYLYALVRYQGVKGEQIVGQMFDPYYYMDENPYQNWPENREKVLSWLKEENIHFIVFSGKKNYIELIKREPQYFEFKKLDADGLFDFYQIRNL